MVRLGLCCKFEEQPIRFRTATVKGLSKLSSGERAEKLALLCRNNAESLRSAIEFCHHNHIGCFRVNSQILPLKTHDGCGYELEKLPDGAEIVELFRQCKSVAAEYDVRLSFHPTPTPPKLDITTSVSERVWNAEYNEDETMTPAEQLEGMTLEGGWTVISAVKRKRTRPEGISRKATRSNELMGLWAS